MSSLSPLSDGLHFVEFVLWENEMAKGSIPAHGFAWDRTHADISSPGYHVCRSEVC